MKTTAIATLNPTCNTMQIQQMDANTATVMIVFLIGSFWVMGIYLRNAK